MRESVQKVKTLRLPTMAAGSLAGFLVAYPVNTYVDSVGDFTGLCLVPIIFLPLVFVLGIIISVWWFWEHLSAIWRPLSASDADSFAIYFGVPFVLQYLATWWIY